MYVKTDELVGLVRNRRDAQQIIASLLTRFSSDTAKTRVVQEARFARQTTDEVASRTASNLLSSFVTRKPGGWV